MGEKQYMIGALTLAQQELAGPEATCHAECK
jgi:hypothetical protein